MSRKLLALTALAAALIAGAPPSAATAAPPPGLQEVMFVGNNWAGTVDVIRSSGSYAKLGGFSVPALTAPTVKAPVLDQRDPAPSTVAVPKPPLLLMVLVPLARTAPLSTDSVARPFPARPTMKLVVAL